MRARASMMSTFWGRFDLVISLVMSTSAPQLLPQPHCKRHLHLIRDPREPILGLPVLVVPGTKEFVDITALKAEGYLT